MQKRIRLVTMLALALVLPPATMMIAQQVGGAVRRPEGPCDIYAAGKTPCVTAHSTTRALSAAYNGPLYQVKRQSDGKTLDVGVVAASASDAGGYADAAAQDVFCADTLCVITMIYDQSGKGNHLVQAPPGLRFFGPAKGGFDTQPIADMAPVTVGGHKVYGVFVMPGMGFRNNDASGLAINDEPEGMYMVFDGTHYDSGCCFDYGNAETHSTDDGPGTMETVYFGTATAWGTGNGRGPWIMGDMEAGLYSGYNLKQNVGDPTIDSWRFVSGFVNGGGGNQWDLRGGNAQKGELTTFYSGNRPGSRESNRYFPMHKEGAVLLGTGGDNGNGSSGTFYEGVITTGYPTDAAINAVQANIQAARYDVALVSIPRITTFAPESSQDVAVTFTNTTGAPVSGIKFSAGVPNRWKVVASGTTEANKTISEQVAPGASVSVPFTITAPATWRGEAIVPVYAGYFAAKVEWSGANGPRVENAGQRVRSAPAIKINEINLGAGQFIELYNAGAAEVDLSNWKLVGTRSQWASVPLATIPFGTKIASKGFYVLGLSAAGLEAPAQKGDTVIQVNSIANLAAGQEMTVDGEVRKIASVGTAASPMTTIFIPVATGPWIEFPPGATNLPVANAAGFAVGQKIAIDLGGDYEVATVTAAGKAATQTALAADAAAGATTIKVSANANMSEGDTLVIGAGQRKELAKIKSIKNVVEAAAAGGAAGGAGRRGGPAASGEIELAGALKFDHQALVDVSDVGTGITFTPATKFAHRSGDAVQALGSGITLDKPLDNAHSYGSPLTIAGNAAGYQGAAPQQWFGNPLAANAGSVALMDASGRVVVDAIVYGSQQSSSSGNGTIASPELATLEGDQGKGGNIVVVPQAAAGRGRGAPAAGGAPARSASRITDGADSDNLSADFQQQTATPGAPNQKPQ